MPDQPQKNHPLVWTIVALAVIGGGALLWLLSREKGQPGSTSTADEVWNSQVIEALSLEAPFRFGTGPDVSAKLPAEVRDMIVEWKTREAVQPATGLRVQVSHITYRDNVAVDLDGAVGGAMSEVGASMGEEAPDYRAEAIEVSGLPARHVSYQRKRPALWMDALFIQRGPHLWQVQTVALNARSQPTAQRLLKSVKLATEPPAAEPAAAPPADPSR